MAFECQESIQLIPNNSIISCKFWSFLCVEAQFHQKNPEETTFAESCPFTDTEGEQRWWWFCFQRAQIDYGPPARSGAWDSPLPRRERPPCVLTFRHNLATNHFGWNKFYFERWGLRRACLRIQRNLGRNLFVERELNSRCFMGQYSMDIFHGHTETVLAVFLLQSAKLIFTSGYDSVVQMWDMGDDFLMSVSRPGPSGVHCSGYRCRWRYLGCGGLWFIHSVLEGDWRESTLFWHYGLSCQC